MSKTTKLIPSAIAPRRAPGTKGRRSPSFPDLGFKRLGEQLGTTSTHVGRVLNGICRPSMRVAERLGALMGWTIDQVNSLYKQPERKSSNAARQHGSTRRTRTTRTARKPASRAN